MAEMVVVVQVSDKPLYEIKKNALVSKIPP